MADEKDEKLVDTTEYKIAINSIPKSSASPLGKHKKRPFYKAFWSSLSFDTYKFWALFWAHSVALALCIALGFWAAGPSAVCPHGSVEALFIGCASSGK